MRQVTVAGLGRFGGGVAVARWFAQQGARVTVTDQAPTEKLTESIASLGGLPVQLHLGGHRESDFTDADLVVASPAIVPTSPYLQAARAAGVPVTTEIRLFIERCPARIVGVTGTKGKSTTTAMIGAILSRRVRAWVGGNIGKSLLFDLPQIGPADVVVLELSSYMLEYLREAKWSPQVAVVTMLAPDHLEWHGSYERYLDAKRTIVAFQRPEDYALACAACPQALALAGATSGRLVPFGLEDDQPFALHIPGRHNQLNAQAAFAAARLLGATRRDAVAALEAFHGLPHRLELVHQADGVRWFNDSIATIPQAAIAALEAFAPRRVIQIVGGYDKHLPFAALADALNRRAKAALCIGATGPTIQALMNRDPSPQRAPAHHCGDLATAIARARALAVAGDVVLLSTGCASYDQFVNFEQRGQAFADLARGGAISPP